MADKLIRTAVVMAFFLVLALFSGCGTNKTRIMDVENAEQVEVLTVDVIR